MNQQPLRVLVVDDNEDDLQLAQRSFHGKPDFVIAGARSGTEALELLESAQGRYDVVLLDEYLGKGSQGIDVLKQIKGDYPFVEVIMLTVHYEADNALNALHAGAYHYFSKPVHPDELQITTQFAAQQGQARRERTLLRKLNKISANITSARELSQILRNTCQAAVELFGIQHSGIVWFEPDQSTGKAIAEYPDREDLQVSRAFGTVIPVEGVSAEESLVRERQVLHYPGVADAEDLGPVREILLEFGIQSILIVPIVVADKVVASISLDAIDRARRFTELDIDLCQILAGQAAVAIEKAHYTDELERLFASSPSGIIVADEEGFVTRINQQALRIMDYSDESEVLNRHISSLYADPETPKRIGMELDRSPQDKIYRYETAVRAKAKAGHDIGKAVPILLSASWLYDSDRNRIGSLGHFEDVRDVGETQRALATAQKAARIVANVLALGDRDAALESVAEGTLEASGCDLVMLYAFDHSAQRLTNPPNYAGDLRFPERVLVTDEEIPSESIAYKMLRHKRMYVAEEVTSDVDFAGTRFAKDEEIESCLAIPLTAAGNEVGVMFVNYRSPHLFEVEEQENIQLFADQAAVAIYNAHLYEQVLEQREKSKHFLQDVTHQLVGPLSGLRAHCENLLRGRVTVERGREILKTLVEQSGLLQRYARNFGFAARVEESVFSETDWRPEVYDAKRLVQLLIKPATSFQGQAAARDLKGPSVDEVSFRDFPDLLIDPELFEIVILNLYDNAVKYSYEGAPIEVVGRKVDSAVEIAFISHGIELKPAEIDFIFGRYTRTELAEEAVPIGTGIGLFICDMIIRLHRGTIKALPSKRSRHGNEVRFVITLPEAEQVQGSDAATKGEAGLGGDTANA